MPEEATRVDWTGKGTFDILQVEAVTADVEAQVKKIGAVLDKAWPWWTRTHLYQHDEKPPFDDIRVRQAFIYAVDRQAIRDTLAVPGGLANLGVSPCPLATSGICRWNYRSTIPTRAEKLLAEAGHPNGFTIKDYFISESFFCTPKC